MQIPHILWLVSFAILFPVTIIKTYFARSRCALYDHTLMWVYLSVGELGALVASCLSFVNDHPYYIMLEALFTVVWTISTMLAVHALFKSSASSDNSTFTSLRHSALPSAFKTHTNLHQILPMSRSSSFRRNGSEDFTHLRDPFAPPTPVRVFPMPSASVTRQSPRTISFSAMFSREREPVAPENLTGHVRHKERSKKKRAHTARSPKGRKSHRAKSHAPGIPFPSLNDKDSLNAGASTSNSVSSGNAGQMEEVDIEQDEEVYLSRMLSRILEDEATNESVQ
ncbi:uncharacterized protein STEHIDRAFT_162289 [Stereum hirsutum FP-91666 SS1]|uniref:uncharacterized protein n=1 Tax=Stereum hirsutum (strain FP-91666) TaxID=721885 RepID=UPI00044496BB|nr:uncharacterized protein STEHIDRAFT_162289 [Stereum hirsutum FP-91666 SS1]EIM81309.1 hypothetical protein STEHIDRAFT_162289 [Stereum hirsutum FP-91666 SS1]